ncbi:MAG: alkaline phosphatase D family protein [Burkholderiales bacterium]
MKRRALLGSVVALAGCQGAAHVPSLLSSREDRAPLRRIAFGSCNDQNKPQHIWQAVLASRPDLFLFAGDNVYASEQPWSAARMARAYETQALSPAFARLRQTVPHMATWDDHDFGLNDGGASFAHKQAAKDEFLKFWGLADSDPVRQREGVYSARVFGPKGQRVQVIMLDTRWFRSDLKLTDQRGAVGKERFVPDPDPNKTLLGSTQWAWLEARLREDAQVRLIVSSIQVLAEGHGWERWGNFPLERARLFDLLTRTRAHGVVFLSGDRHIGALYRETRGLPYPLFDLTSSGLTHPWKNATEAGPNRLGGLVGDMHFGTVDIDWPTGQLTLALRGVGDEVWLEHKLGINTLQPV